MAHRYSLPVMFVCVVIFVIATSNDAQYSVPYTSQTSPTPALHLPDGFRGVDPIPSQAIHNNRGYEATPTPTMVRPTQDADSRGAGDTYAVVAAGDVETIHEALDEAFQLNQTQPGVPYRIYLAAGEYLLAETLVVFGTVEIYGAGMSTTILRQIGLPGIQQGSMNTMIKVPGKSLKIDNVTLVDGKTNTHGGAINLENFNGTLTVTNSKFLNNQAIYSNGRGGAIYSLGILILEKVYFEGNSAANGGAIAAITNVPPSFTETFTIEMRNVDFKGNSALTTKGGAIYHIPPSNPPYPIPVGKIKIRQSNFRQNTSTSTGALRKHIYSEITASVMVNAIKNFWNNPTVAESANLNGVNTNEQKTAIVQFTLDAPQTPPPDPVQFRYRLSSTGLRWLQAELDAVAAGVMKVGIAFNYLASTANTPQSAFNLAMIENSGTEILFIRVDLASSDPIVVQNYQYQYGTQAGSTATFQYPPVNKYGVIWWWLDTGASRLGYRTSTVQ